MLKEIPIPLIESSPLRVTSGTEEEILENSLTKNGQLAPIRVRRHPTKDGSYTVIFGNRRLSAAKKLGWKHILAEVVDTNDLDSFVMAFSENADREDFTDYEKALILEKIHLLGNKTYAEVAKIVGRSAAFVSQHVAMLHLFPENVADEDERLRVLCRLTERHARILSKIDDNEDRWDSAKFAVSAGLGVRELQKFCSSGRRMIRKHRDNEKAEIRDLILSMARGLSSNDLRPSFDLMSENHFTMFSRFPPFERMDRESAKEHIFEVVHTMENFEEQVRDLDIRIFGNFAYATMYVHHNLMLSGRTIATKARATMIFAKEDRWKLLHEHWSAADPANILDLLEKRKKLEIERVQYS